MADYHHHVPSHQQQQQQQQQQSGAGIGGLNIKNRLKNSFNLFRTNDIPEIKDPQGNPQGRGAILNPPGYNMGDPRHRPVGPNQNQPNPYHPQDRPRGYLPQQPPPHLQQGQRAKGQGPPDYYDRGRPPRPGGGMGGPGRPPSEVRHRLFVALFDYDPPTMSPNPDACDEELPFREGHIIKVSLLIISLIELIFYIRIVFET